MNVTALIIIVVIAVVILILVNLGTKETAKGIDKTHFLNEWKDVIQLAKDKKTQTMSVVHADKLLDEALKCIGYKGDTMAERLVSAKSKLKKREEVWVAHKMRNKIVHETTYKPSEKQVKNALLAYNKAFKDLGVW